MRIQIFRFVGTDYAHPVTARATGRCLCGRVVYEVRGPLRDVVVCHCVECQRAHGAPGAYSAAHVEDFELLEDGALRWVDSPESDHNARRGFCAECGSSLFWQAPGLGRIGIAAGTLDGPTGLRLAAHIYTHQAGDWDELPDDGLPRDPDRGAIEIRWS
jgi:hypothetical protein